MPVQMQQLDDWRRSEQRVRRTWKAWLAAPRGDRRVAYSAFEHALAEEEHAAAEVERTTNAARPRPVVEA